MNRPASGFSEYFTTAEPKLRRALAAAYGAEDGRDAAAEALTYGWEHWERVSQMKNPDGYLFRVGQSAARRIRRQQRPRGVSDQSTSGPESMEPELHNGLQRLTERQREIVVLVHGLGWSVAEVSRMLDISQSSVQNHLARGIAHLRNQLEVNSDAWLGVKN